METYQRLPVVELITKSSEEWPVETKLLMVQPLEELLATELFSSFSLLTLIFSFSLTYNFYNGLLFLTVTGLYSSLITASATLPTP